MAVVIVDERDDRVGEFVDGVELAMTQRSPLEDGEERLDMVEPRRMRRRVVQEHSRVGFEELLDGDHALVRADLELVGTEDTA